MIEKLQRFKKHRDAAALLPILGGILFLTPFMSIFTLVEGESTMLRAAAYIFGAWVALIICAAILSKKLSNHSKDS